MYEWTRLLIDSKTFGHHFGSKISVYENSTVHKMKNYKIILYLK